ncbi:MAG: patatin-like phospholipase family protein [Rhodoferax sp.]|nr:patatin-like phospholipase family protein [Rhodoferax sp.]
MFFRHTGQSFGRSALMLSGGANLGMFHIGVIKALQEHKLLPRVISGSSAGAVVAAFVGTKKDSELDALFRGDDVDLDLWRRSGARDMLRQKSLMDIRQLETHLRKKTWVNTRLKKPSSAPSASSTSRCPPWPSTSTRACSIT